MTAASIRMKGYARGARFRLTRKLIDRSAHELWPGIESAVVTMQPFAGKFGNLREHELMTLCAVTRYMNAKSIFEFGTFDGLSAWHLAANTGPGATVWTLDLPLDHPARSTEKHDRAVGKIHGVVLGKQFVGTPEADRIEQLYGDSLNFDPERFRGQIDLCLVDASHEYEHVKKDTENGLIMVRPGGVIFWDDYSRWWPGVQKCLDELATRLPVCRVRGTAMGALRVPTH